MNYLIIFLAGIVLYDIYDLWYKKFYLNWRNKYFCKKISEVLSLKHRDEKLISYNNFEIVIEKNNFVVILLHNTFVASWYYVDDEAQMITIHNEILFNNFKENYLQNK